MVSLVVVYNVYDLTEIGVTQVTVVFFGTIFPLMIVKLYKNETIIRLEENVLCTLPDHYILKKMCSIVYSPPCCMVHTENSCFLHHLQLHYEHHECDV